MTAHYIRDSRRSRRIAFIHAGAISSALYLAPSRWWHFFLDHRFSSALRWRCAVRAGLSPTSPSGSPGKSASAVGEQSRRYDALPQRIPRPGYLRLGAPVRIDRHSPTRERILTTV